MARSDVVRAAQTVAMDRKSVLVASSRTEWSHALRIALEEAGLGVAVAAPNDRIADVFAGKNPPDLAVLDAAGAEDDDPRWELARRLVAGRLLLVVSDAESLRRGFQIGAEDCVTDSAHAHEVVARCEAVLRRTDSGQPAEVDDTAPPAVYVDRRLWINYGSRQVWVRGEAARLTPREFRLLAYLIAHRDKTIDHGRILEAVWGREPESERPTEVLKQYIWRLRQKIEADPEAPEIVITVPGAGYRFVGEG